jgi:hypothetical protein
VTRRRESINEAAILIAAYAALALVITWPLALGLWTHLPNDLGDPVLNAWILAWDAGRIAAGFRGIWDAPAFFPYPHALAYSENLIGIALFTAPIQWITGNPVFCYNVAFLGSFVLAGTGMYLLARTLTGRRDAAFLAGLVFAFTPYRIAHVAHLQMMMSGWMPISLWALHRYFATGRWRMLWAAGAAFVLQSVSNGYFMYFAALPLAIVGLAEIWRRRPPLRQTLVHVGVVVAAILAALAPVARAYYVVRESQGLRRSLREIAFYSADLSDYLHAHHNIWLWRTLGTGWGEHELFPGFVVLFLAAALLQRGDGSRSVYRAAPVPLYGVIAAIAVVLTLGPEPKAWGHALPFPGPYRWLLFVVPGLDGLRGVARLDVVVILCLAVMAAFGAAKLLDRVGPSGHGWIMGAAIVVALGESWTVPIATPFFDPHGDARDRDAYEYLRASPPGGVFEMPSTLEDAERDLRYQYMTLWHHHPVVNGHSGYWTPLITFLDSGHSPFNELDRIPAALDMLRAVGVRYLVLHSDDFENREALNAIVSAFEAVRVSATRRFARTIVATLAPSDVAPAQVAALKPIPPATLHARASHQPGRLPLMFDGDRDSRWLSGDRQAGGEWIEIELDGFRDVAAIGLQLGERSFGDYPRELVVEALEEKSDRVVFRGSVLPRFGQAIVADGEYPWIDVPLPANRSHGIRLRQLGTTRKFFWSIHELRFYER